MAQVRDATYSDAELREMIARHAGGEKVPRSLRVLTDTSDFFGVEYDDVLVLEGRPFFVRNYEREGRFGIDEEPKFWVRRAVDLLSGETKVLKMVFRERFTAKCGRLTYECVRSPVKEARVLELVRGWRNFAQGSSATDSAGNRVRIVDFVRGDKLSDLVQSFDGGHEEYYHGRMRGVLDDYIDLLDGICALHALGQTHGDIRRDHVIKERLSGVCVWIDFDFDCLHGENMFGYDLAGLGNVLIYLVGRGDVTLQRMRASGSPALGRLGSGDMNILFVNRVADLRKVYPYISEELGAVLRHFSLGAESFYESASELAEDVREARESL